MIYSERIFVSKMLKFSLAFIFLYGRIENSTGGLLYDPSAEGFNGTHAENVERKELLCFRAATR